MMKNPIIPVLLTSLILGSCQFREEEHRHQTKPNAREVIESNQLRTGTIKDHAIIQLLNIQAKIEAPPQSTAQVYPIVGAYVKEVYVIKGQKVEKAERLARLHHPDILKLQEEYLSTKIALERSEKDYTRKQKLVEQQAVSEKELQNASAAYFSAQSKSRSLASTLRSMGINPNQIESGNLVEDVYLLAPIPGNILDTRAGIGQYAGNNAPLFNIVNNSHLHLELQIPPRYIDMIHPGNTVKFIARTRRDTMTGEVYLINEVAEESGFFNVHAHFHDEVGVLHPGTYAEASIIYASDTLPSLPKNAIWHEDGIAYVAVVENDQFTEVPITTGISSDTHIAIIDHEKLRGKEIVLNGVRYILGEVEAGHSH